MQELEFPALYNSSNRASRANQNQYFWLIKGEYLALSVAAVMALDLSEAPAYYMTYALVFFVSLAILIYRSVSAPEQAWYRSRALAESIKTSTWRYMMRAEPFDTAENGAVARAEFRNYLKSILNASKSIGEKGHGAHAVEHQITPQMDNVRSLDLERRKEFYRLQRIMEQKAWYAGKVKANKRSFGLWLVASVLTYVAAVVSVLGRIAYPKWGVWPTEPLIVLASAFVGWVQVKKFNELASAYTITAHEIGIAQSGLGDVDNEAEFSQFVNETELVFSREHTLWLARQQVQ